MARPLARNTRLVPWKDDFREFFELAAEDWTPPGVIRSTVNDRRDRMSLVARFRQQDGSVVKLTTRCRREGEAWYVVERNLDMRLTFGGGAH